MTNERESRPVANHQAASSRSKATDSLQHSGLVAWRRRHDAAVRTVPLDCGCRDPWTCHCDDPPLSEKMTDAGRDAALHLLGQGKMPLLERDLLRSLYRRGGTERQLAEMLWELTNGQVA